MTQLGHKNEKIKTPEWCWRCGDAGCSWGLVASTRTNPKPQTHLCYPKPSTFLLIVSDPIQQSPNKQQSATERKKKSKIMKKQLAPSSPQLPVFIPAAFPLFSAHYLLPAGRDIFAF